MTIHNINNDEYITAKPNMEHAYFVKYTNATCVRVPATCADHDGKLYNCLLSAPLCSGAHNAIHSVLPENNPLLVSYDNTTLSEDECWSLYILGEIK